MGVLAGISAAHRRNLQTLREQPLSELSGSLGDLGTLLPLMIALALAGSISLPSTLVFTGLANILTGLLFGIPLPVQPMKAIAAVAIARNFEIRETMAAGITVSACILFLSVTGLLNWFGRVIPVPVVKGIQVGAGLSLILSGGTSLLSKISWTGPSWADNHFWTLFAFLFLLASTVVAPPTSRIRIPYALCMVLLGLVFSSFLLRTSHQTPSNPALWHPHTYIPTWRAFGTSLSASLGQLPLTTLNSIIAVSHLSADLLPQTPEPTPTALGLSVAAMNLVGCWFGAMPACHGSGGLAAQYRFGARSGASIIVLGTVKLFLGLFVGDALLGLLGRFPKSLLGVMVVAAGVELAKVGESLNTDARDLWEKAAVNDEEEDGSTKRVREVGEEERRQRWSVMLITVAGLLAFRNDGIGFLAGMAWHFGLKGPSYWQQWRGRRSWAAGRGRVVGGDDEALLPGHDGREGGMR